MYRMKKRMVLGVSVLLALSVTLVWLAQGRTDPIFKDEYDEKAKSSRYISSWVWPEKDSVSHRGGEGSGVSTSPSGYVYYLHRGDGSYANEELITTPTITVFDPNTNEIVDEFGDNLFQSPHGIEVDSQNNIWVTDIMLNKVFKLDERGNVLAAFGDDYRLGTETSLRIRNELPNFPVPMNEYTFARPTDVTVMEDGSFIVADGYRNHRIVKFNRDGNIQWEVNAYGSSDGEFNLPHGITHDQSGNIYVADRNNARIQVFDQDGQHLSTWDDTEIGRPYGIDAGNDGNIYLVDGGDYLNGERETPKSQIVVLSPKGEVIERFGSWGNKMGQLRIPHDLTVLEDGTIFVAELLNERLQKFTITE